MPSMATNLGLHAGAPCHAPYYLMFNFLYAYAALASRSYKQILKLDHNVSPREDIGKYGDKAVQSGKITQEQLNKLKRNQSAHENRVENFTMFAASTVLAVTAGVSNDTLNTSCLVYTVSSIGYGLAYVFITDWRFSLIRSKLWWVGNISCLYLCWKSGQLLNIR